MSEETVSRYTFLNNKVFVGIPIVRDTKTQITELVVNGNLIITGSRDGNISIFDTITEECKILSGHTDSISSICVKDNLIISSVKGYTDNTIRIWDINTNKCIRKIKCNHSINKLITYNNFIVSFAGGTKKIRIWDINDGRIIQDFDDDNRYVFNIVFPINNLLITGMDNNTIKIWDINNWNCIKTLSGPKTRITALFATNNKIISGSHGKIHIWDMNTWKCINTLDTQYEVINTICMINNILITASSDMGAIQFWNIDTGKFYTVKRIEESDDIPTKFGFYMPYIKSLTVKDNLITCIYNSQNVVAFPISLFPGEFKLFKLVADKYYLARHLETEIWDYFIGPRVLPSASR